MRREWLDQMPGERGQAAIEWIGLVLLASLALGAATAVAAARVDGRAFGGFLVHRIVCVMRGGCDDGDAALAKAYGSRDAALLRRHAPGIVYESGERQLPVDWRECRRPRCAVAPDDGSLDTHRSDAGARATLFTRVVRRHGRLYLQYWLYYPDSNTTFAGSDKLWGALRRALGRRRLPSYPGFHRDDWEGYQVRIDRRGRISDRPGADPISARSTSHGHWQWCKQNECRNRWGPATGWTRVSRGSHAGHVPLERVIGSGGAYPRRSDMRRRYRVQLPGRDMNERTSTAEGLRLLPLESIDRRRYRPNNRRVAPPWRKRVYRRPEHHGS